MLSVFFLPTLEVLNFNKMYLFIYMETITEVITHFGDPDYRSIGMMQQIFVAMK